VALEVFFAAQRQRVAETLREHTIRLRHRLLMAEYEGELSDEQPQRKRVRDLSENGLE
jgi:hypothetical protein